MWHCRAKSKPLRVPARRQAARHLYLFLREEPEETTMKNIGVLGSGVVGQTLADGLLKHGYQVMRGSVRGYQMSSRVF